MTVTMFDELESIARAIGDDRDIRVVILTGAGKAFCAGYDLDEAEDLPTLSALEMLDRQEHAARALSAVRAVPVPVIAAVNGPAAGGGMSLTLMADIRLGSPAAKFNAAFVRIGLSAGDLGASWLLPRLIGPSAAAEIGFTGRMVEAEEAERLGWPKDNYTPQSLEEKIVCYADKCIGSTERIPVEVTIKQLHDQKLDDAAERVRKLHIELTGYLEA
jgi:enoyl-CoA hydratase/carnithine racemase